MSEDRRFVRVRPQGMMSKTGKIIIDPKKPVINCTVIDLSASGACLQVASPAGLPKRFEFLYAGVKKKVQLIWTRGFTIGVTY
jgi:hypothetical protein